MSKLPKAFQFLDISDYGRKPARWIAQKLQHTPITPVGVTFLFIIAGVLAIYSLLLGYYSITALLLIIKSILDAADGELARLRNTPSYVGRYLDSISDLLLNFMLLVAIGFITNSHWGYVLLAFLGMQLQGTLYNFWYVILRKKFEGEQTSRIYEVKVPQGYPGENQNTVKILFYIYIAFYGLFDRAIYFLDPRAPKDSPVASWLMTLASISGLGFQLLLIGMLLNAGLERYIIPFFIYYTLSIPILIILRKIVIRKR